MSKLLYIKFKLPITINLFLLPLNILSSSNFSNEFQESISETIITNIKTDISQFFNKMETILTYNIRFSDKELGGKLSWLNKHEIVIKYLMKIEGESLKIQVGYEEIAENKKTKEEMMELCQSFQSFLKNLIDEYDLYLMIE